MVFPRQLAGVVKIQEETLGGTRHGGENSDIANVIFNKPTSFCRPTSFRRRCIKMELKWNEMIYTSRGDISHARVLHSWLPKFKS